MVEPQVALFGPDFATGYRHRVNVSGMWLTEHRNFIRTSNLGLRDRDRPLAHGAGPRAVISGRNSIIEAVQVGEVADQFGGGRADIVAPTRPGAVGSGSISGFPEPKLAVLVARLQTQGLALSPDLAIVVVDVGDFINPATTDDREFTGYRPDAAGEFHLSYGFRNTSGYRFRTSRAGRAFYWLLDHSEVARIISLTVRMFAVHSLSSCRRPQQGERAQPRRWSADSLDPYVALSDQNTGIAGRACRFRWPSFATSPPFSIRAISSLSLSRRRNIKVAVAPTSLTGVLPSSV